MTVTTNIFGLVSRPPSGLQKNTFQAAANPEIAVLQHIREAGPDRKVLSADISIPGLDQELTAKTLSRLYANGRIEMQMVSAAKPASATTQETPANYSCRLTLKGERQAESSLGQCPLKNNLRSMLQMLAHIDAGGTAQDAAQSTGLSEERCKVAFQELQHRGYIFLNQSLTGKPDLTLTTAGRSALLSTATGLYSVKDRELQQVRALERI